MKVNFLGLDKSFVELSVKKLIEDFCDNDVLDLSNKLLLSPSSRFNRNLQSYLFKECKKNNIKLYFGDLITPGLLPKKLNFTNSKFANHLEEELALFSVLVEASEDKIESYLGKNLNQLQLYNFTREFRKFFQELSRSFIELSDVLEQKEIDLTENEVGRIKFFSDIRKTFYSKLEALDLLSSDKYLNDLINTNGVDQSLEIILFNCIDLTPRIKKLISLSATNAWHYIYANEKDSLGFSKTGEFLGGYWINQHLDINSEQIRIVDNANLQASLVASELLGKDDKFSVIYRDDTSARLLSKNLSKFDIKHTLAVSENLSESLIGSLLKVLSDYIGFKSFDNFLNLVKHPVIFKHLNLDRQTEVVEKLLNYQSKRFQDSYNLFLQKLPLDLVEFVKKVNDLTLSFSNCSDLKASANTFYEFIEDVFSSNIDNSYDGKINEKAFELVVYELLNIKNLSADFNQIEFDFSKFCNILLNALSYGSYFKKLESEEVKIVGSLEALLDDSKSVYFIDCVQGFFPEKVNNNWFLPDSVRKLLKLNDNQERFAREAYFCKAISISKANVFYYVPKFSLIEREEYFPSQIFYQLNQDKLISVVNKLYNGDILIDRNDLDEKEEDTLFEIEVPKVTQNVNEMSITSFKSYLRCPYRYYLWHVKKLDTPNNNFEELSPVNFGIILHDVLENFAKSDFKDAENSEDIFVFLKNNLTQYFKDNFGSNVVATLDLQKVVLEKRLKNFANFQAKQRADGYKILHSEYDLTSLDIFLDHEHGLTKLKGRIDRIDVNEKEGKLALYDYKTSNNAKKPSTTHMHRGEWVDLQLPLYNYMLRAKGEVKDIELGFINLSSENSDALLEKAKWSDEDLEEAVEVARKVAASVYSCKFWPPTENYIGDLVDFMFSSGVVVE